jgi:hypothetical protein
MVSGWWLDDDVATECKSETSTRYKSHMSHTVAVRLWFARRGEMALLLRYSPPGGAKWMH